jgi:CheY-like chemotaxis protein
MVRPRQPANSRGLRILVVASALDRRIDTALALVGAGHAVDLAESAEDAIRHLELFPPDVIVTDLALAGVGGELFALSLRHGFGRVGIVAVAGRDTPSTLVRCRYARIDVLGRMADVTPHWLDRAVRTAVDRRARREA